MKAVAIIQARMTSTRLPGKVMLPLGGRPLLERVIERVGKCRQLAGIVVATTVNSSDDPIAALTASLGVDLYRGSELDVLSRYAGAMQMIGADPVVRITSDCPLIDPQLIDEMVETYAEVTSDGVVYVSNMLEPTYPLGMAVEVIAASALGKAQDESNDSVEREHVTPYIYRRPRQFKLHSVKLGQDLSMYRCTVDTPEDYRLVLKIFDEVAKVHTDYSYRDIMAVLDAHPQWQEINRHIVQVKV